MEVLSVVLLAGAWVELLRHRPTRDRGLRFTSDEIARMKGNR